MTRKLWEALQKLGKMKEPSVEKILRKRGFGVEADAIKRVVDSFDDFKNKAGEPGMAWELMEENIGEGEEIELPSKG